MSATIECHEAIINDLREEKKELKAKLKEMEDKLAQAKKNNK
jgi:BMFP domain-containing protein YqiC